MKHCPKCGFLYLDSDQVCDLDQTLLITDDVGSDVSLVEKSEQKPEELSLTAAVHQRKLNLKTVLAATVAGLIIGLLLLSYQRMRPTLQASQAPPTSQAQTSQASRVTQIAKLASNEAAAKAALAQQASQILAEPHDNVSPSAKPLSSTAAKTTLSARPDSARLSVSSNPVSTGDVANSGRGPVTIRLANGSTLQADEVWRTKAGIWYRRKGIVTFLKPNRVRAMNHSRSP
ncbi:MAG: hypothetical protein ND866_14745 [Pyrinomonadaceae bacterium]|nr:hypothetical protein [Pyrinomonadaceae bacterium]